MRSILPKRLSLNPYTIAAVMGILLVVVCAGLTAKQHRDQIQLADAHPTFTYQCNGDPESEGCLEKQYQTYTEQLGVAATFVKLEAAYKTSPVVRNYCHPLAHVIGRTEADMVNNVDIAYAQGNNFCWSGYYHGVMESIVSRIGVKNLPKHIPTICDSIKKQHPYSFAHYNCVHGLGHGIMDVTGDDLPKSLTWCNLLTDNWEEQACYSGVFMENEMDEVNTEDHSTKYFRVGQPMYPCTAVADRYKTQCYLMQTSHVLRTVNDNFAAVFKDCSQIEPVYANDCYQSLGRDASGNSDSTVGPTKVSCMLGQTEDAQANCVIGAVKDFISYYNGVKQADKLCESLDAPLQPICQTTKTQYYSTF